MDTGFGAILERFEKAFGKHVTNSILALIGIATAVFCCSVIWKHALGPVVAWLSTFSISIAQFETRLEVAWYAAAVAFGYGFTHLTIAYFEGKKLRLQVDQLNKEKEELEGQMQRIEEALDKAGV